MKRIASLLIVDKRGMPLGVFGPFDANGYPPDTGALLDAASRAGLSLSILRLLEQHSRDATTAKCTYLAEALAPITATQLRSAPAGLTLNDHPLRLPYARPGGNAADLAWAASALAQRNQAITATRQERTWNLSCVHRLTLADGNSAWLKVVPPFFHHEGRMLSWMRQLAAPTLVPDVLAADEAHGRVLLSHVPGALLWGVAPNDWQAVIDSHVLTQAASAAHVDELVAFGAPDWRASTLQRDLAALVLRDDVRTTLPADTQQTVDELIAVLPQRLHDIAGCGLPATLVHGDLHQGNVIAGPAGPVVLDWGDAGVGHPLFDLPGLCHGFSSEQQAQVRELVLSAWRRTTPDAAVDKAAALMAPLAALRQALIYRGFLDRIEPSERHYHETDVPDWLTRAVTIARPG